MARTRDDAPVCPDRARRGMGGGEALALTPTIQTPPPKRLPTNPSPRPSALPTSPVPPATPHPALYNLKAKTTVNLNTS